MDLARLAVQWVRTYQEGIHLFGSKCWDERWTKILAFELPFIYTHLQEFFSAEADIMILHDLVAKISDWIYSSLIHHENPVVKVPKMLK